MVEKFENGKVYAQEGDTHPYEMIFEAGIYTSKNDEGKEVKKLMIDTYVQDGVSEFTHAIHYETEGSLEPASSLNPEDFVEIGTVGVDFVEDDFSLTEKKPSYLELQAALQEIVAAKPSDFSNYHKMASKLQLIAQSALGAK